MLIDDNRIHMINKGLKFHSENINTGVSICNGDELFAG